MKASISLPRLKEDSHFSLDGECVIRRWQGRLEAKKKQENVADNHGLCCLFFLFCFFVFFLNNSIDLLLYYKLKTKKIRHKFEINLLRYTTGS